MTLQTFLSTNSPEAGRLITAAFIALAISMTATVARSQRVFCGLLKQSWRLASVSGQDKLLRPGLGRAPMSAVSKT